jgi:hypothetical protein
LCATVLTSGFAAGGQVTQRPDGAQVLPALHMLPGQQSCPTPPQLTTAQLPPTQLSPALQAEPLGQHGWPFAPQAAATHVPLLHVNPALQGVPAVQHACPEPPHMAPPGQPAGGAVSGFSLMVRRHVAHLLQSPGVVTCSRHRQPPSDVAEHVEPLANDTSVAVHASSWKPASQDEPKS